MAKGTSRRGRKPHNPLPDAAFALSSIFMRDVFSGSNAANEKRPSKGAYTRLNEARGCCAVVQRTTAVRLALAPVEPRNDVDPNREHENAAHELSRP
jgi:hypothetical protein